MSNDKKKDDWVEAKDIVTIDFVKSDPCYGCRYAVLKTKKEMERDGIFARRFFCASKARVNALESKVIHGMVQKDFDSAAAALEEMRRISNCQGGLLNCEDTTMRPWCYVLGSDDTEERGREDA